MLGGGGGLAFDLAEVPTIAGACDIGVAGADGAGVPGAATLGAGVPGAGRGWTGVAGAVGPCVLSGIIPVSKWLVTPIYKPFRPFIRGITPVRGLTNHGY